MATKRQMPQFLHRKVTRRNVLATAAGASVLAAAYSAFGRDLLDSGGTAYNDDAGPASSDAHALEREEVRISHLLRRAGFGVTREDYDRYVAMGLDATIDEVLNYSAIDDSEAEALAARVAPDAENIGSASMWWVVRMANSKRPFQEKMTLFWHGLLTSQVSVVRDPVAMAGQNEYLRAHALGRFPDILKGITHDRAMMVYLDIAGSRRNAPNENYARELMELFALGEGHFSEEDVREGARAFTGWSVPRQRSDANNRPTLLDPIFTPRAFDNGSKTVLGQTGDFDPGDVIDIITKQPQSARYITGRLFEYFVYPSPSDAELQPFIDVYLSSGMNIGATVEGMLRSEVFYSPKAYRAIVKSPVEYAVGAVRTLGLQANTATLLAPRGRRDGGALGQMGQVPMEPPNVAGWPGGASWLNSSTMFARLNFLNTLGAGTGQPRQAAPPPAMPKFATAAQAFDHYASFLLDANVPDAARQAALNYAGGPDAALTAEAQRDLVYLLLAMPQYHLS